MKKDSTVRACFSTTLWSSVLALVVHLPQAHAQISATSGKLSRDEAIFQLALTTKVQADQSFLLGDRAQARVLYDDAAAELKTLDAHWSANNDTLLALLDADIAYRQALLRYDADFWGATYSLTPINPVDAYGRFAESVKNFEDLVTRIDNEQQRLATSSALADSWRAAATGASTDSEAQALQQISDEVKATHHATKATAIQDRIDRNIQRQKDIAAERTQLAARYDAAHKQFDTLAINAVLATTGVPPELKDLAASDRPLEQRILAAGRTALASNSALVNSFSELSKTTAAVVDAARMIDEGVSELERLDRIRRSGEATVAALRRGTLEGALEAGRIVYEQLPEADKAKLTSHVLDQVKPAMALFETAHQVQATLDSVVRTVSQNAVLLDNVKKLVAERALENAPAFDRWYRQQVATVAGTLDTANYANVLMEQAVRGWPRAFVAALPPDVRARLRQAQNAANDAEAAAKAFRTWPPAGVTLTPNGTDVEIRIGTTVAKIDLRSFLSAQQKTSLEALQDYAQEAVGGVDSARRKLQDKLGTLATRTMEARGDLGTRLIGSLHELAPSTSLSRLIPTGPKGIPDAQVSAQLFDTIWQQLPQDAKNATSIDLTAVQAGSMLGSSIVAATQRRPAGNPAFSDGDAQGKAQEAVLKAAVSAAFPAAGAALLAADALSALGTMNSLADQINALTSEDRRIMAEQITLFDLIRDERAAVALADVGMRIAERRRVGALVQADKYMKAAQRLDDAAIKAIGAQRLYLPRAFLLAEQLRYQFDRLDRSLAFWTGDPRAPRGRIAHEVVSDPQWLRYALDPSIQLFSWLDRSNEGDRGALRRLAAEWQQKLALASAVCDKLQCKQSNAVVGEVTTSPEISFKTTMPEQWQRYLNWRTGGTGEFVFELLLTPELLKPDRRMHNIRFVAARAGVQRGAVVSAVQGLKLEHSGAAYVPFENTFVKEHYLPRTLYGVSWKPFGDLRVRWQTTLSLLPLEGYGVYTLWRIVLPDSTEARNAEDIKLQLNIQFQDRSQPADDRQLMAETARKKAWSFVMKTHDNVPVTLRLSDLPFFGFETAARKKFASLVSDEEAATLGFGGIELREEQGATP